MPRKRRDAWLASWRTVPHLLLDHPEGPIRESQLAIVAFADHSGRGRTRWLARVGAMATGPYIGLLAVIAVVLGWWNLWLGDLFVASKPILGVPVVVRHSTMGFAYVLMAAIAALAFYWMVLLHSRRISKPMAIRWPVADWMFAFGLAGFFVTSAFAGISSMLVQDGVLAVADAHASDRDLFSQAFGAFAWHMADTIPLLKVPETVNWDPALGFPSRWGGTMLLLFKLALIVPTAQILAVALPGFWAGRPPAEQA